MKYKRFLALVMSIIMILALTSCDNKNNNGDVSPSPEMSDIPNETPLPEETSSPEPIIENNEEPILENNENQEVQEFNYSMQDNPPEPIPKIDAANQLVEILGETLTKSLSQNKYTLKMSEVLDSNSLYGNINFRYRAIDMSKVGDKIYFDALNGSRFYKGTFSQLPGGDVQNISAKNLITSRNLEALKELGIENGINEIYCLFANVISFGDNYDIYKENPDLIDISFQDLDNGMTQYNMTLINSANYSKTASGRSSSYYVDKLSKQPLENSQTTLILIVDNDKLIKSILITDTMSCGFYNQTSLTRYISFDYGIQEDELSDALQSGNGELPITSGSTNKETNAGRIIKYTNPNSADTSGGIDDSKWTMSYKKTQDGSSKAVQYHGSPLSNYNVNGIKANMTVKEIKECVDVVIQQDTQTLIGLVKKDENIFTIVCYLGNDMTVKSIDAKLNPLSDVMERALTVKPVGSYVETIQALEPMSKFNSHKETLVNKMYNVLTKSFTLKQVVSFDGQNVNKYSQESFGTEIHPELNYIYQSLYKSSKDSENYDIERVGSFVSPSTILNVFIQNAPNVNMDMLNKTESEDGTTVYNGEIDIVEYEKLINMACDYQDVKRPDINDFNNVPKPTKTTINIEIKDDLITSMQIKSESKRDVVIFDMTIEYL